MATIPATTGKIKRYMNALELAEEAADYAGKIKFEMVQQSGDNYTMVWSEQHDGWFPPADN